MAIPPSMFARSPAGKPTVAELPAPTARSPGALGILPEARQVFSALPDKDGTRAWQAVGGPYRNVREFGAVGDGVTDDTAAFAAAIAAVFADVNPVTGMPRQALYVPAGVYVVEEVWVRGDGFRMFGDGTKQTILYQTAPGKECVLRVTGGVHEFSRFGIAAIPPACPQYALLIDARTMRTTTNVFRSVFVNGEFVEGVRVGYPGNPTQCDQQAFFHCSVIGGSYLPPAPDGPVATKWRAGFVFGTGTFSNNLAHAAYWLQAVACQHGVEVSDTQLYCASGLVQSNEVDFYGAGTGYLYLAGIRSEASSRFFDQPNIGGFQSPFALHLADCAVEGPGFVVAQEWLGRTGTTGVNTVVDPTAGGWATNQWVGYIVVFRSGNLGAPSGDWFAYSWNKVVSNTADTLTVVTPWGGTPPDAGSEYVLIRPATGGTGTTLVDATRAWKVDELKGWVLWFVSGSLIGQHARVVSNTATTITFDHFVFPSPDASTGYVVTNASEDCGWFRCQVPGNFEVDGLDLYGTPMRWALGRPPVMILHGDKRPALWTLDRISVKGADRREAIVTNGTASVIRRSYQEIDAYGDVANADFQAADPGTQGGLDLISTLGIRLTRPGPLFTFNEALGHPLTAGLDPGANDGELVLVGDVRADGASRCAAVEITGDYVCLGHERLLLIKAAGKTVTLPAANIAGAGVSTELVAVDFTGALSGDVADHVRFVRVGADTVNGATQAVLAEDYGRIFLASDGVTAWSAAVAAKAGAV